MTCEPLHLCIHTHIILMKIHCSVSGHSYMCALSVFVCVYVRVVPRLLLFSCFSSHLLDLYGEDDMEGRRASVELYMSQTRTEQPQRQNANAFDTSVSFISLSCCFLYTPHLVCIHTHGTCTHRRFSNGVKANYLHKQDAMKSKRWN